MFVLGFPLWDIYKGLREQRIFRPSRTSCKNTVNDGAVSNKPHASFLYGPQAFLNALGRNFLMHKCKCGFICF